MKPSSPRSPRKPKVKKLFVLDTNVLMHDPASLFRFEEHDLYLPMGTLEELDANKKGLSDVARNARQASRFLNQIVSVVRHLQKREPARDIVLVSKDINMRIKARALGLAAEDYTNDKVLEDADLLYTGVQKLGADFWETHGKDM